MSGSPAGPVLDLDRLSLSFGGLRALSELDLRVDDGEIVSLIGPNGAGKTTVFNVITGVYQPSAGDVRFAGQSIAGLAPHKIARLGIARTFQSLRLFLNMSVIENVMAATYGHTKATPPESVLRLPRARREEREVRALAEDVLSFFGQRLAGYRWDQPAYSLSYANRRRLEIARALGTGPRLLLLDEPAAGMNPAETHEITELIGRLRDERGVSILVIEHDMHVVAGCSDRVIALDHGVKIAEGGFDEVASHPAVVEAYMGRDPEALADAAEAAGEAAGEAAEGTPGGAAEGAAGEAPREHRSEYRAADASTTSPRTTGRCGSWRESRSRSARASWCACSAATPPASRRR